MTDEDRLGIALFEVKGQTLPPDVGELTPVYSLRCSACSNLLGEVFKTSQGGLLWSRPMKPARANTTTTKRDADGEHVTFAVTKRRSVHAFLLDDLADDLVELRCSKHGWRALGPAVRLRALLRDTPKSGVLALESAKAL